MITFDTIGLSYDTNYLPNWVKDTVKKSIEKYSRYGLTTLFFEDKISSVQVLFNQQSDVKESVDEDGFTVVRTGEDIVTYKDKQGNKRTEKTRNLYKIPSWSYLVNMRKQNNEIKVEFSIPKYLYGHNLNLFPNKEYYYELKNDPFYSRLIPKENFTQELFAILSLQKFVNDFTWKVFGVGSNVFKPEVYRIDISYNYRFKDSKATEAFRERIKDFFRKVHKGRYTNYNDKTFAKITQQYSVKIYDKEAEFLKHDYKELFKYFNDSRLQMPQETIDDNLRGLTNFSKNVFRAEISLRKNELKELFFNNAEKFSFRERNIYLQYKPMYNKVFNCMRSLNLIKSYLEIGYENYDYKFNQVTGNWDEIPVAPYVLRTLTERQMKTVRKFLDKYRLILAERYFPIADNYKESDDTVYYFLNHVLRYVVGDGESTTVNVKLFSKQYREAYERVLDIEKGWSFYLDVAPDNGKCNINDVLLKLGYDKLCKYVNTFSKLEIKRNDLISFMRNKRKAIKDVLHINSNNLIPFVVAKYSSNEDCYCGYPKASFYRNEEKLNRVVKYYNKFRTTEKKEFEFFDMNKRFDNTCITTQICSSTALYERIKLLEKSQIQLREAVCYDFEKANEIDYLKSYLSWFVSERAFTWVDLKDTVLWLKDGKGNVWCENVSHKEYFCQEFREYLLKHGYNPDRVPAEFWDIIETTDEFNYFISVFVFGARDSKTEKPYFTFDFTKK